MVLVGGGSMMDHLKWMGLRMCHTMISLLVDGIKMRGILRLTALYEELNSMNVCVLFQF